MISNGQIPFEKLSQIKSEDKIKNEVESLIDEIPNFQVVGKSKVSLSVSVAGRPSI